MATPPLLRDQLGAYRNRALLVGGIATLIAIIGALFDLQQFLRSYLVSYVFWIAFPLGSLAVVLLHRITGGAWGFPIRRLLEAATRTLPLMALLFVPIALGTHYLYEWTHEDVVAADPLLQHKAKYLNLPFWLGRAVLYFAVWIAIAVTQERLSARQDRDPSWQRGHWMRTLAAPSLGLYGLMLTFAAVDWVMSIEPHWFSTIYGPLFLISQALTAFAFGILGAAWLSKREPFARWISAGQLHDVGKLLFTFVLLWAYVQYSQYLLIWYANIEEETPWYLRRTRAGWQYVAGLLIALHFALPFLVLLSRKVKRDVRRLSMLAGLILFMRYIDTLWLVTPSFDRPGFPVHWMDLVTTLAIGGFWAAYYCSRLQGRPLLTLEDAHLEGRLEPAAAHPVPHP